DQGLAQLVEDLAWFAGDVLDVENVAGGTPVRGREAGPVQGGRQGPGHCRRAQRHLELPALPIGDAHGSGHIEDTHRSRSPATPNSAASSRALSRTSNRSCTVPRPADPNLLRRPASSRRVAMLAAIPSTSWGRAISPLTPGVTSSGMPPADVVTTGRPLAIASMITFGMPSRSPSRVTKGVRANTSASR